MRFVVDTNVLFSFFRKESLTRKLIVCVELFELCTLESRIKELKKYEKVICEKARISEMEFKKSLEELVIFVEVIKDEEVKEFGKMGKEISPDIEDTPLFALALALKCDIWSSKLLLANAGSFIGLSPKGWFTHPLILGSVALIPMLADNAFNNLHNYLYISKKKYLKLYLNFFPSFQIGTWGGEDEFLPVKGIFEVSFQTAKLLPKSASHF